MRLVIALGVLLGLVVPAGAQPAPPLDEVVRGVEGA
jgi:hypothetical protein